MREQILKSLNKLDNKELKFLNKIPMEIPIKDQLYNKIPDKLSYALEAAFKKAFEAVFIHGTTIIEKTFNKENIELEYEAHNYIFSKSKSSKTLNRLDNLSFKSNIINTAFTTISGFGLGALGIGLPDIPLLVSVILKGVYEIALSYGFKYDSNFEKIYILKLIKLSLSPHNLKFQLNKELDSMDYEKTTINKEIILTSKILSDSMLVEKFIQGFPIVGIIGGLTNNVIYRNISKLATIKFKRRYLLQKLARTNITKR